MAIFPRCKKAELTDAATGQKVAAGVSAGPMDSLMIAAPLTCKVETGNPVNINFLDPALGVVTCRCILTSPLTAGNKQYTVYRCHVLKRLAQNQRREDIKIPLNLRLKITHDSTGISVMAAARNISARGIYLIAPLSAKPKDLLTFHFHVDEGPIPLTAEILRVETTSEQGSLGFGCRFIKLSPRYESLLRSYVFKEERRLYKEERTSDDS